MFKQEYETYDDFFKQAGEAYVRINIYGTDYSIRLEEMYEHFKTRMIEELNISSEADD
jgi:hypothetical protein